jgi:PKD repeat protein
MLEAGAGLISYQWSTGEINHQVEVKKQGKYNVLVKNSYGCYMKDSINVYFTDNPKLNLSGLDTLTCGSKSTSVNISADKGIYQLRSPDPSVTISGMAVNVLDFGIYPFSFVSTDQFGCSSDTAFTMGFHKIPKVSFSIDETECYGYNLNATYIGDANIPYSRFTWVFGGDTISSNKGQNIESIPLGDGQTKRDLKLTVNDAGCSDSSAIRDIRVIPTLSMSVVKPLQCLPVAFDFKGFNTETGVVYQWDFGDGIKSLQKDVTHTYAKDGYYDVSLTVTTNKGCFNTMVKKKMVYVAPIPTVGFSIPAVKCLNPGKDTLYYAGSASAEDSFHWNLKGFDPVEIVQSPDTTAGPFVFDLINKPKTSLSLHVTSQYGCLSDTVSLEVKRKPVFSFTSSVKDGCAPLPVSFKARPDDPVDQMNFKWEFGDGDSGTGADVIHSYLIPNLDHDIRLSALSSVTGCSDSLLKTGYIVIHPVPKAGFNIDHDVIFNDNPKVSFTDQSVDAINYYWDFGDGLHSREKDVVHNFDGAGVRKILQTVYNQFDCQDTTSKYITIVFNQLYPPNAFSPNSNVVVDREFKLYSSGIVNAGYHLTIISRWNDVVFECKNEIKGWDGKMQNGNYAPPGAYIWILECFDIIGRPHRQTGALTLVY